MEQQSATLWEYHLTSDTCKLGGLRHKLTEYALRLKPGKVVDVDLSIKVFILASILENGGITKEWTWNDYHKVHSHITKEEFEKTFHVVIAYCLGLDSVLTGGGSRLPKCDL